MADLLLLFPVSTVIVLVALVNNRCRLICSIVSFYLLVQEQQPNERQPNEQQPKEWHPQIENTAR